MKIRSLVITAVLLTAVFGFGFSAQAQTNVQAMIAQLQAQIASLMAQIQALQAQQGTPQSWCHNFNTNIKFGDSTYAGQSNIEVASLEVALVKEGFTTQHWGDSVTYDERIASAVVAFQEKYASSILAPNGLTHGTGYVGPSTRAKLNALYGCGITPTPTPQPTPTTTPAPTSSACEFKNYKMAFILVENLSNIATQENINLINNLKQNTSDTFSWATKGASSMDTSYPVKILRIENDPSIENITTEFYKNNLDTFDFITIFNTYDNVGTQYHVSVKNNIKGIGQGIFNRCNSYGSTGKLLGVNWLKNVNMLADGSGNVDLVSGVNSILHETSHQWGAFVSFIDNGQESDTLKNPYNTVHWDKKLETGYDLLNGYSWTDNGDGTFTAKTITDWKHGYSNLDLYLMGLLSKDDVGPIKLIVSDYDTKIIQPGTTISGTLKNISVQQIINAEGEVKCNSTCTPNWQCGAWNDCINGYQTRTCTDTNNCGVSTGKPAIYQTCTPSTQPAIDYTKSWVIVFAYEKDPLPDSALNFICNSVSPAVDSFIGGQARKYGQDKPFNKIICVQKQVLIPSNILANTSPFTCEGGTFPSLDDNAVVSLLENKIPSLNSAKYVTVIDYIGIPRQFCNHDYNSKYDFDFIESFGGVGTDAFYPALTIDQFGETLSHEFMHKLGAADKYSGPNLATQSCCLNDPFTKNPYNGDDIMCHKSFLAAGCDMVPFANLTVSEPTAMEIGWKKDINLKCDDTDGNLSLEQSYYVKGTTIANYYQDYNVWSDDDYCKDGQNLVEYYCNYSAKMNLRQESNFVCPNGCKDGACIASVQSTQCNSQNQCVVGGGGVACSVNADCQSPVVDYSNSWVFVFTNQGTPLEQTGVDYICNNLKSTINSWVSGQASSYGKALPYDRIVCLQNQIFVPGNIATVDWGTNALQFTNYLENNNSSLVRAKYVTVFNYVASVRSPDFINNNAGRYSFIVVTGPFSGPASNNSYSTTVIHEFTHALGATDKYAIPLNPTQCCLINPFTGSPYDGHDIMCHEISMSDSSGNACVEPVLSEIKITDPTAVEINWKSRFAQPLITVTSPNNGMENWKVGETHNITWTSSNVGLVRIQLVNGDSTTNIASSVTASAGTYIWTVQDVLPDRSPKSGYKIHIFVAGTSDAGMPGDYSDNTFTISPAVAVATTCNAQRQCVVGGGGAACSINADCVSAQPAITIVSPNGWEAWKIGETHNITWQSAGLPSGATIFINLSDSNKSINYGISTVSAAPGTYSWTIPATMGGSSIVGSQLKMFIISTSSGLPVLDTSDNYFSIVAPVTIPCLNGTGPLLPGQSYCSVQPSPIPTPNPFILPTPTLSPLPPWQNIFGYSPAQSSLTSISDALQSITEQIRQMLDQ